MGIVSIWVLARDTIPFPPQLQYAGGQGIAKAPDHLTQRRRLPARIVTRESRQSLILPVTLLGLPSV